MSSLKGKTVIVTGSSSGIGLATALLFASKGCNVTVTGRNPERLQKAVGGCVKAGEIAGFKIKVISVGGDISDSAVIKNTVEKTVEAFGRLDVVVANHGITVNKGNASLETWTQECFDTSMKVNVGSVIELIQVAVPHLEKTRGNVVCVSSLGSTMASVQPQNYLISKASLDHVVRCLALQLGPKGIRINAINPTFTPTRLVRELDPSMQALVGVVQQLTNQEQPLQGQVSKPEEQAEVIVFLASDAARMVHGQCLAVDGGLSLKGQPSNFPALFAQFVPPQK